MVRAEGQENESSGERELSADSFGNAGHLESCKYRQLMWLLTALSSTILIIKQLKLNQSLLSLSTVLISSHTRSLLVEQEPVLRMKILPVVLRKSFIEKAHYWHVMSVPL